MGKREARVQWATPPRAVPGSGPCTGQRQRKGWRRRRRRKRPRPRSEGPPVRRRGRAEGSAGAHTCAVGACVYDHMRRDRRRSKGRHGTTLPARQAPHSPETRWRQIFRRKRGLDSWAAARCGGRDGSCVARREDRPSLPACRFPAQITCCVAAGFCSEGANAAPRRTARQMSRGKSLRARSGRRAARLTGAHPVHCPAPQAGGGRQR